MIGLFLPPTLTLPTTAWEEGGRKRRPQSWDVSPRPTAQDDHSLPPLAVGRARVGGSQASPAPGKKKFSNVPTCPYGATP
jgi:hypothetical protein